MNHDSEYKLDAEDQLTNEPLISFIDNDLVLDFLNECDHPIKPSHFDHIQMNQPPFSNLLQMENQNNASFLQENYNKFNMEGLPHNNLFFHHNNNDGYEFQPNLNNQNLNNNFLMPQNQTAQLFPNGINSNQMKQNCKMESQQKPIFNAQSLAYSENFNPRSYIKNTYINKINNLMTGSLNEYKANEEKKKAMIKIEPNLKLTASNSVNVSQTIKEEEVDFSKMTELEKLNLKLKRNRESARNSRKRKKIYIDLLETKVTELSDELTMAKKALENNAMNFAKMNSQSRMMNNLILERQSLFEKLDKGVKNHLEENEINLLIDSLRLRLGASGKDRIHVLNFFFRKFFNLFLPPYIRYLLWVSLLDKDIFAEDFQKNEGKNDDSTNGVDTNLLTKYQTSENFKKMLPKYKKKFLSSYSRVGNMVDSMNKLKEELFKETNNLENILDEFRNVYKPRDIANFLLDIEQNKSCQLYSSYNLFFKKDKDQNGMDDDDEDLEESEIKEELNEDDEEIKYKGASEFIEQINGSSEKFTQPNLKTNKNFKRKKRHTESDDDI